MTVGSQYLVEDTNTNYLPRFGGGYKEQSSFIAYAKRLADQIHNWHRDKDDIFPLYHMLRELTYMYFFGSTVALKKAPPIMITS